MGNVDEARSLLTELGFVHKELFLSEATSSEKWISHWVLPGRNMQRVQTGGLTQEG